MTSRQRMLNRSGAVEPERVVCCWWMPARTAGGTRTATVATPANGDVDNDSLEPSTGDPFDRGLGRELNDSQHSCRKYLACIALGSSKSQTPWSRSSVRVVPILRWTCCNTTAWSAFCQCSSDTPEPVPRHSNPRASRLAVVRGYHNRRPSGAETSTGTSTAASHTINRAAIRLWSCTAKSNARGVCVRPQMCGFHDGTHQVNGSTATDVTTLRFWPL